LALVGLKKSSRVFCYQVEEPWPYDAEVLEQVPVLWCTRRGPAVDLVLDRPRLSRSQFVFTEAKGHPAIFWQTQKTARGANPGGRIPRRRAEVGRLTIAVDTRERYPYRFTHQGAETHSVALSGGDYAVHRADGKVLASVERKSLENLCSTLSDGTLSFQMARLGEIPHAGVVVEGRYSGLLKQSYVSGAWLAEVLSRLEVRYPEIRVVFAESRRFAEEWTYRFLAAAAADAVEDE